MNVFVDDPCTIRIGQTCHLSPCTPNLAIINVSMCIKHYKTVEFDANASPGRVPSIYAIIYYCICGKLAVSSFYTNSFSIYFNLMGPGSEPRWGWWRWQPDLTHWCNDQVWLHGKKYQAVSTRSNRATSTGAPTRNMHCTWTTTLEYPWAGKPTRKPHVRNFAGAHVLFIWI